MKPGELEVRHEEDNGRHVLRLVGELDLASADGLEQRIGRLCVEGSREIVLDLSELDFVDSSGLRAMLTSRQTCERSGCELVLVNCKEQVRRVLELTGIDGVLHTREEAPASGAQAPRRDASERGRAAAAD